MKKRLLIWLAGGMLLVVGSFFIPAQSGSIWPSLIYAGVGALIYLIAFCWVWLQKIESTGKKRAIGITIAVMAIFSIVSAGISYEGSKRQTALLPEIRTTIETGIAENYVKKHLLETMRSYYTEGLNESTGLGAIFRSKYDSLITEDSLLLYEGKDTYEDDEDKLHLRIYVKKVKPDSIVLVAESGYKDGENPEFENYSGVTGKYQAQGILTTEGIRYERTN